ncbi:MULTISPECIES: monovalent cation/H+ antiporter complex subunit F [unclassified Plantactinospora]|uniref:monovalent cation/H+ antiporter complex subunit F n=1 Tax=unclassified Plantactinospora TaxID=2631981 RepID=UPI000D15E508|nr:MULTISPECIES: monovalent cation/H+ antiporter complex subunit F [unclassified Plantactinospora]AVT30664.1 cation:proton antiporter [Plantactinospora sp. BC1]AVT37523.1 cation:proton antiporter [Plantactinospora sp. BB1]
MIVAVVVVAVLLSTAAGLALVRVVRGPALLDRVVAAEVLISIIIGALGAEAAVNRHATTLPILIALSMLGFVGSVALVRFAAGEEA